MVYVIERLKIRTYLVNFLVETFERRRSRLCIDCYCKTIDPRRWLSHGGCVCVVHFRAIKAIGAIKLRKHY